MKNVEQLHGVDVLKYIMAIGVITIHVGSVYGGDKVYSDVVVWWMRSAVPFFFITTGYLLARKLEDGVAGEVYLQKLKSAVRIFCCWLVIYLPVSAIIYWQGNYSFVGAVKAYCVGILTYGQCPGAPLWYVYALIGFLLTMYCAVRLRIKAIWCVVVFAVVYTFDYCIGDGIIGTENLAVKWIYLLTRRLLGGGLYLFGGLALYRWKGKHNQWLVISATCVLSILLYVVNGPLWELMSGIMFFVIGLRLCGFCTVQASNLWMYLRRQSMWIYFVHMIPIFVIVQADKLLCRYTELGAFWFEAVIGTLIATNVIALIRRRHKWLDTIV